MAANLRLVADPDRRGGSGLSLQTLAIASAASLTAAMLTSRLFPPGTIYASALTPVIVAAVSEMLSRSHERVAQLRAERKTMVLTASGPADADAPDPEQTPEVRHYRRRGVLHPKVWVVTGVAAFTIALAALTLPELIFGGAVAGDKRTTFFGGGSSSKQTTTTEAPVETTPQETVTETAPAQTPPTTTTETQTQTAPTETTTTETTPTETTQTETVPEVPTP
jgi:hypothetical protein